MSSFFTLPASLRKKRKRADTSEPISASKRQSHQSKSQQGSGSTGNFARRDESISGSESAASESASEIDRGEDGNSSSSHDGETGAERRLRLAERYLQNVREEVQQVGFDAEDLDRDLIAERLKEDVAESKGQLYRFVVRKYDYAHATRAYFRAAGASITSVATCPPFVYTTSKDIQLTKWELDEPTQRRGNQTHGHSSKKGPLPRLRPRKVLCSRGNQRHANDKSFQHHTGPILCVTASPDGRFVVTGSQDKRLIMWSAVDLSPLRVFSQHRDCITSLAIQPSLNRLYTASYDRTIKTWGLNEQAYIETLFGHQDHVLDIAALANERCLSAGARDRTVRLWKVVDETQLVFRGGGTSEKRQKRTNSGPIFQEGSIERVAVIDNETFVTGSDNGALQLWNIQKKKPIFTIPCAHGFEASPSLEESFAETEPSDRVAPDTERPRWITALATVPYSDVIVTGSWDGHIRVWRISEDKKRIESAWAFGQHGNGEEPVIHKDGEETKAVEHSFRGESSAKSKFNSTLVRGCVNDLAVFERGERGRGGMCIVAALGREHRLGRWKIADGGKNDAVVFEIPSFKSFFAKRGRNHHMMSKTELPR